MKSVPLNSFPRTAVRRGGVKKLRASGRVPAVVYGRQAAPQNLELNGVEIKNLINHSVSENVLVDLSVENDPRAKRLAMIQDVQHHPLHGTILHVDLHEVAVDEKITIMVPVTAVGESAGVKNGGGLLEHVLHKVRVSALPKDLPEQITVDVTALEIGKSIHLSEIVAPAGVEIFGEGKAVVFAVVAPVTEAEETAASAAASPTGEVEMTKEKKEDGAEGAKPDAKAGAKTDAKASDKKEEKKK